MFLVFGSCLISCPFPSLCPVCLCLIESPWSSVFSPCFCYSFLSHSSVMSLSLCLCLCYLLFHFNSLSFCVNCFQFYFLCLFGLLVSRCVPTCCASCFYPVCVFKSLVFLYFFLCCPILLCVHLFSVTSMFPL